MDSKSFQRLEKLIRLAGSDNENEAMLAFRNALKLVPDRDLWGFFESRKGGSWSHSSSASRDTDLRRINALERQIRAKDEQVSKLEAQVSQLREKLKTKGSESSLNRYYDKPGFLAIHYEVMLQEWIEEHKIKASKNENDWASVADLKDQFERSLGKREKKESVSVKRFSQIFADTIGVKAVKGGPKRDLMGFPVRVTY